MLCILFNGVFLYVYREKQTLLDDALSCKKKMDAASTLINGLSGERIRWTAQSKEFKSQIGMCACPSMMYIRPSAVAPKSG